ncbi:hypothetical protein QYE76_065847 [Lolium multiflorum]|uniref:RNase H type-1 domain-containing protein n=1 Tax=Lolium multiflorum TaxID=4521 RepID=A0AAD8SBN1_LOLMU|nr:hypothetical protein QYE76_065847 [Lolium multiflorum]
MRQPQRRRRGEGKEGRGGRTTVVRRVSSRRSRSAQVSDPCPGSAAKPNDDTFVENFLRDLELAYPQKKEMKGGHAVVHAQRWLSPPSGMCKLNVDGAVARSLRQGDVGAVCRGNDGSFLGASAVVFEGVTHPGRLEAMACREGIALATNLHIGAVMIASNCLEVVQGLQMKNLGQFSHILRETAEAANARGGTVSAMKVDGRTLKLTR